MSRDAIQPATRDEVDFVRLTRRNLSAAGVTNRARQDRAIRGALAKMRARNALALSARALPIDERHPYTIATRRELSKLGVTGPRADVKIREGLARLARS